MKKKIMGLLLWLAMLMLAGCGKEDSADANAKIDSLEILQTVWDSYDENDRFSAGGGDSQNAVMDAPGKFDVTNAEELDSTLGFPADAADKIDDAASLVHMMNANTFTGGAYHVKNKEDVADVAKALKENILGRQWMCGFPEKLMIVVVDDNYVISAFGLGEQIDKFQNGIENAYENTEILYEESI